MVPQRDLAGRRPYVRLEKLSVFTTNCEVQKRRKRELEEDMSKVHLNRAKSVHDDEFYTPAEIVDKIIDAYRESLRGKSVYCPCDSEKS